MKKEIAMFGGGCFWGVEASFGNIPGVLNTQVGYSGGETENPTYEEVSGGTTHHAEVVRVEYDSEKISYNKLLDNFFKLHNPTEINRQGADVGDQYRSVIFFYGDVQKRLAQDKIESINKSGLFKEKVATEVIPAKSFHPAEEYHQKYLVKRGCATCD